MNDTKNADSPACDPMALQAKIAARAVEALTLVGPLSRREVQVLGGIALGLKSREIADALKISSRTVDVHRGNITSRLDLETPVQAARLGVLAGLDLIYADLFHVDCMQAVPKVPQSPRRRKTKVAKRSARGARNRRGTRTD